MDSLIEFPTSFSLRAIGNNTEGFQESVIEVIERHVPEIDRFQVTNRLSGGDKYLAVTFTFMAQSQVQLDAIYEELNQHQGILMLL
jgi:putative lipoic acid-binding regulatory protein